MLKVRFIPYLPQDLFTGISCLQNVEWEIRILHEYKFVNYEALLTISLCMAGHFSIDFWGA
jgi:hypothetical protein